MVPEPGGFSSVLDGFEGFGCYSTVAAASSAQRIYEDKRDATPSLPPSQVFDLIHLSTAGRERQESSTMDFLLNLRVDHIANRENS